MMPTDELDELSSPSEGQVTSAEHVSLAKRARTAALWVGSTTVIWQGFSWALTLLTARILLPDDYGILSLTETVSPFLGMLAGLNLTTWIVQTDRFESRDKAAMYSLTSVIGLAMTVIGISLGPLLGSFFENPEMVRPFQAVALTFVLRGTAVVPLASLQRNLDFKPIALMNLTVGLSSGVLQLLLAWLGFGYWSLVVGILYRELATVMWAHVYVGLPRSFTWVPGLYRRAIAFGAPATMALIAAILFTASDKVVVGKLFSVEFLGYYSMAFFLTDLPLAKINSVLRPVFLPYFARLRGSPERMKAHFSKFVLAVTSVIFPVLVGLAVVAPDAVGFVLGEKWLPLVRPLQVLALVGIFRSFTDNVPHLLLAVGQPMQVLRFRFAYLAVLPVSFALAASLWGIVGIYLTWLVIFPLVSVYALVILRRVVGISPSDYALNLLAPIASTVVMAICTYGCSELIRGRVPVFLLLGCQVTLGAGSYAAFYWWVFREDARGILGAIRGGADD